MKNSNSIGNIFKSFGLNIAHMFIDFFKSFKYNPSKLAGYLVAIPGIIIGFALNIHTDAIDIFCVTNDSNVQYWAQYGLNIEAEVNYSGFILFVLMLAGCINLFNAVNIMKKRNLASAISALVISVIIIVFGIFFITYFYHTDTIMNHSPLGFESTYMNVSEDKSTNVFTSNSIISMSFMYISMASSFIGSIWAILKRDKTYKKEII